jgi:hypothetical protein
MKPSIKKVIWGIVIVIAAWFVMETVQLFFINGTTWKARREMEKSLLSDDRNSYDPALQAEIRQTEAYRKFKETPVQDSLRIYLNEAVAEGKARLKRKDSIPR